MAAHRLICGVGGGVLRVGRLVGGEAHGRGGAVQQALALQCSRKTSGQATSDHTAR